MKGPHTVWIDYQRDMYSFSEDAPTGDSPASQTAYYREDVVRSLIRTVELSIDTADKLGMGGVIIFTVLRAALDNAKSGMEKGE